MGVVSQLILGDHLVDGGKGRWEQLRFGGDGFMGDLMVSFGIFQTRVWDVPNIQPQGLTLV